MNSNLEGLILHYINIKQLLFAPTFCCQEFRPKFWVLWWCYCSHVLHVCINTKITPSLPITASRPRDWLCQAEFTRFTDFTSVHRYLLFTDEYIANSFDSQPRHQHFILMTLNIKVCVMFLLFSCSVVSFSYVYDMLC